MDLPPISRLRFREPDGRLIEGPAEWAPALIEVLVEPERWKSVQLARHGDQLAVSLRHLVGGVGMVADWPRAGTGSFRLRLKVGDEFEERLVRIDPIKIDAGSYAQLLEDLESRLPTSVALGLQRAGALIGIRLLPPEESTLAQELVRLRRAVRGTESRPGLTGLLVELARDPHRILSSREFWVRRERARRPHPARLALAVARGHNLDAEGRPERVLDTRVEHTVDVYENRLVQAYAQQVQDRLQRLVRVLGDGQATVVNPLLPDAQQLLQNLRQARQQAVFLNEVELPSHLPTRLTMVLLKRAPYRAALEGYLELHRSARVQLDEPAVAAPLENLPTLYQVWGTLEIISVLLAVAAELGYQVEEQRLVTRRRGEVYVRVLRDGEPAVRLRHPAQETEVRLVPERTYGMQGPIRSISYRQRPDVAVEVVGNTGGMRVYIFDPKYKLDGELLGVAAGVPDAGVDLLAAEAGEGRPKKVDIDTMHAYRDAMRDDRDERVVRYAAIMYPGPETYYGEGIEALRAYPGDEQALEQRVRAVLAEALGVNVP